MASQDTPDDVRSEVFETRIALTFFGGVSLAVYESGVAVEFFRLVTGDGIYRKLRDRIGPVIVDIISGTSAGGLSAAFLATALINRSQNLDPLMNLWLEKASFDTLLNTSTTKAEESLFDGDEFLNLIKQALDGIAGIDPDRKPYQQYLDLFVTATSLQGDVQSFPLWKQLIDARSHQRVLHFRYRGNDVRHRNIGEREHNDFDREHRHLLAIAARASASFPMVFAPVEIDKDKFEAFSPELKKSSLHIDGGILDNKPIRLALDAVFRRRADKQIDRRLLYVEPIPEEISYTDEPWNPLRVLYAAVKDLPSYQSITSALQDLQQRNEEVAELRQTLDHYETLAAKAQAAPPGLIKSFSRRIIGKRQSSDVPIPEYVPANDTATQLFRAQEDGYLDLRFRRNFRSVFDRCQQIAKKLSEVSEHEQSQDSPTLAAFYHLKTRVLWCCDFQYHRRHYQYLHQIVRQLFARLDEGELVRNAEDRRELFHSLNDLRSLLNKHEADIVERQEIEKDALVAAEQAIDVLLGRLLLAISSEGAKQNATLINSTNKKIARVPTVVAGCGFFALLRDEMKRELDKQRHRFDLDAMVARNSPAFRSALENGYNLLRTALDHFHERDMIIYPMMRGDDMLASELQKVLAARVGPLEGINYVHLVDPRNKLAGKTAFHFGGFMNQTWRGNDLIWGRLDAVETIFKQLLPKGDDDPLFKEVLTEQKRIVVEMRQKFGVGIVHPLKDQNEEGEPPREDQLIGKQNIEDIPYKQKVVWLKQGIAAVIRMIFRPGVHLSGWYQRFVQYFFVRAMISPRRAVFQVAAISAVTVLVVSAFAALVVGRWLPGLKFLADTAEVIAVVCFFLLIVMCFILARIANSIRSRVLRTEAPLNDKQGD